jgi:hypothetical protein
MGNLISRCGPPRADPRMFCNVSHLLALACCLCLPRSVAAKANVHLYPKAPINSIKFSCVCNAATWYTRRASLFPDKYDVRVTDLREIDCIHRPCVAHRATSCLSITADGLVGGALQCKDAEAVLGIGNIGFCLGPRKYRVIRALHYTNLHKRGLASPRLPRASHNLKPPL